MRTAIAALGSIALLLIPAAAHSGALTSHSGASASNAAKSSGVIRSIDYFKEAANTLALMSCVFSRRRTAF